MTAGGVETPAGAGTGTAAPTDVPAPTDVSAPAPTGAPAFAVAPTPAPAPSNVSLAVVTYNNEQTIGELLASLELFCGEEPEVYVIDNASTDNTVAVVTELFPWVRLIRNARNGGFGAGHNTVLPLLTSTYHAIVNPDILFIEDALSPLVAYLGAHPETALVTPRILSTDGSEQKLPKRQPRPADLLARRLPARFGWVRTRRGAYTRGDEDFAQPGSIEQATGSFLVLRTALFRTLGGFDERFFLYFEDNDLSLRAADFGSLIFCPQARVVHGYRRAALTDTRHLLYQLRSAILFYRKYPRLLIPPW